MLNTVLIAVTVAAVSFYIIANNMFRSFSQNAARETERAVKDCNLYIDSVAAYAKSMANNDVFFESITEKNDVNIIHRLDYLCSYSLKIDGAVFYTIDGEVYTSSSVSGAPELLRLTAVPGISEFITSEETAFVSLRTRAIASIYNNIPYSQENGIVTAIVKVIRDGTLYGYLFCDVAPAALYEKTNQTAFITLENGYFKYPGSDADVHYLEDLGSQNSPFRSRDRRALISPSEFISSAKLVLLFPVAQYRRSVAILGVIIFSVTLVLLMAAHFFASKTSAKTVGRLEALTRKISGDIVT
ncbi:MAG: hypothetical protein LBN25_01355 [Christensenellaceae bacterium]|jgi:hypothetical protein|nr:hypothetical protein [Christensenellaceae bacterium]